MAGSCSPIIFSYDQIMLKWQLEVLSEESSAVFNVEKTDWKLLIVVGKLKLERNKVI